MSAQPIQKDGAWWRRDDDGLWLKWDAERGVWLRQVADQSAPQGPAGSGAGPEAPASPARASSVPVPHGPAAVEVTPFRSVSFESAPSSATASRASGKGKIFAVAALVVAAAAAGFFGLRSGSAAPSAEDVDRAFAPLTGGYT
jgi:hypothetical protein